MRFSPPEPEIELYRTGFGGQDILGRHKSSKALSDLLERIEDPLVVAFNGKWGTGKTHFLKRWVGAHQLENDGKAQTIYFDAFLHDYLGDPLPALVSALSERCPEDRRNKLAELKSVAIKLAKPLTRLGTAVATYGATEVLSGVGDAIATSVSSELKSGIDKYWSEQEAKRSAMVAFQEALAAIAVPPKGVSSGASVIFVIDELDRCRPDFALELLEIIKHFFSVQHVHFVLGVNLAALENSVRARYGNEIDATSYLKKFISVVLDLPTHCGPEYRMVYASNEYFRHLLQEMSVPNHIAEQLEKSFKLAFAGNEISSREAAKIASSLSLLDASILEPKQWLAGWLEVLADLMICKVINPDLYPRFLDGTVTESEIIAYFNVKENALKQTIDDQHNPDFDADLYWKVWIWRYITGESKNSPEHQEHITRVGRLFGRFGYDGDTKRLPISVHRKWLDNLKFYSE